MALCLYMVMGLSVTYNIHVFYNSGKIIHYIIYHAYISSTSLLYGVKLPELLST